jgi:hypothetical protein
MRKISQWEKLRINSMALNSRFMTCYLISKHVITKLQQKANFISSKKVHNQKYYLNNKYNKK